MHPPAPPPACGPTIMVALTLQPHLSWQGIASYTWHVIVLYIPIETGCGSSTTSDGVYATNHYSQAQSSNGQGENGVIDNQ